MATTVVLKTPNPGTAQTIASLGGIIVPANGGTYPVVPDIMNELEMFSFAAANSEIEELVDAGDLIVVIDGVNYTTSAALAPWADPASLAEVLEAKSNAYQEVGLSSTVTTTSTSFTLLTGVTTTPAAGTYLVMFSGVFRCEEGESVHCEIRVDGVKVSNSERSLSSANTPIVTTTPIDGCLSTQAVVTVDGEEAVSVRWRVSGGTGTALPERNLTLVKLA